MYCKHCGEEIDDEVDWVRQSSDTGTRYKFM
jgi:hypothetical protein